MPVAILLVWLSLISEVDRKLCKDGFHGLTVQLRDFNTRLTLSPSGLFFPQWCIGSNIGGIRYHFLLNGPLWQFIDDRILFLVHPLDRTLADVIFCDSAPDTAHSFAVKQHSPVVF